MALTPEKFERLKQLTLQGKQKLDAKQASVFRETSGDVAETFRGVGEELFGAGEKIVETATDRDLTPGEKLRGVGAETFRGASRAFGEAIIGAGKTVLPQRAEEAVARKVQEVGGKIGETEFVQNLVRKYQALPPETKREVDNALGFGEGLAEILTAGAASRVVKPVISAAVRGVEATKETTKRLLSRATPRAISDVRNRLNPQSAKEASDVMVDAYRKSFVADNVTVNKKLDKQARESSFGDKKVTPDDLIRDLADAGVFPTIEGKLAKFDDVIENLVSRQNRLAENINPVLRTVPEITSLNTLRKQAQESLRRSQVIENLPQAQRQLDTFFNSFEAKWGKDISAEQVNEIRIAMNSRTKAFGEETFKQDTANVIASVARRRIDELVPTLSVKEANAEWGRLQGIKNTASLFDNQPINVGFWGGAFGRYLGVIGLSTVGLDVAGPGGLVVAGVAAKLGGDAIAQMLRNKAFSAKARELLIQSIQRDDAIVQKLISEADEANKALLERVLLPKPGETSVVELPQAEIRGTPIKRN